MLYSASLVLLHDLLLVLGTAAWAFVAAARQTVPLEPLDTVDVERMGA